MRVSASPHHLTTPRREQVSKLSTQHPSFFASIKSSLRALGRDRRGATTVEYLVLVAIIALGGIAAMKSIKDGISTTATQVGTDITGMKDYAPAGQAPGNH
jgi:Flp pilus assembly pilin Flp